MSSSAGNPRRSRIGPSCETPHHIFERLDLDVFHDVDVVASSRADAYRFLDDNRRKLLIPTTPTSRSPSSARHRSSRARRAGCRSRCFCNISGGRTSCSRVPQFGRFNGETDESAVRRHARPRRERERAGVGAQARHASARRRRQGGQPRRRRKGKRGATLPCRPGPAGAGRPHRHCRRRRERACSPRAWRR